METYATHKTMAKWEHLSDTHTRQSTRVVTGRSMLETGLVSGEITMIVHKVYKINSSCTFLVPPGQVLTLLTAPMALQAARSLS